MRRISLSTVVMALLWQAALYFECSLCQTTYRVASIMSPPFIMLKSDNESTEFTGFVPEFFSSFRDEDGCTFEYVNVKTKRGDVENRWEGIMNALARKDVDLGVGPITKGRVSDKRGERSVHYSGKFADHQGWTAVVRRPVKSKRDIIQEAMTLFRPFKVEVWLAICVAFAVVSVFLALVNLINPYEWRALYKRDKVPKCDADQLSPTASVLVVLSTLTWQGYEKIPRSIAGKVLLFFWFGFVAATLASYIANMTNLLAREAHERSGPPKPQIGHPFGLLDKTSKGMKFGTVDSWPIIRHLEGHSDKRVKDLAEQIKNKGDNVHSVEEGLRRVRSLKEDYAFIIDTVIGRYLTRDNCDVMMLDVIDPGDMKGYAFATLKGPGGSELLNEDAEECLREHLMHMSRNESTQDLWKKWDNEYKYGRCWEKHEPEKEAQPAKPLFVPINVYQFCGPLALVGLGLVLCLLATIAEVIVHYVSNKLKKVNILGASSPIEEERRLHDDLDDDLKA